MTEKQSQADTGVQGLSAGRVVLKSRRVQPFLARHPWVFAAAIDRIEGDPNDGDVVELQSDRGRFVARGILNRDSLLRVRLYTWDENQPLDRDFWKARLDQAISMRRQLGMAGPNEGARLVYSESDGLSGLVVDWFAGHVVAQINSRAMAARWPAIAELLIDLLDPHSLTFRIDKSIAAEEGIAPQHGVTHGELPVAPVVIEEHGLKYEVDLLGGQKTGFYLDQRENRLAASRYMRERRVLDLFCYTGGFSLASARLGGAREVIGIDSSKKAIAAAEANARINRSENVQFRTLEAFDAIESLSAQGARFGAIVLDPPKFTRTRKGAAAALQAYFRLNRRAVDLLSPGGILVTCSCSGGVTREAFFQMLAAVSQKSARDVQVLEQRGASPDHPVSTTCPETEYLKCLICRIV